MYKMNKPIRTSIYEKQAIIKTKRKNNFMNSITSKIENVYAVHVKEKRIPKIRSVFLELNRNFDWMYYHYELYGIIRVSNIKAKELYAVIKEEIPCTHENNQISPVIGYYETVIKTIQKFIHKCQEKTMQEFTKLPGYLPLDVKRHIVSYISLSPIKPYHDNIVYYERN